MNPLRRLAMLGVFEGRRLFLGFCVAVLAAVLFMGAQVVVPLVTGAIVDEALLAKNKEALWQLVLLLLVSVTVSSISKGVHQTTFTWLTERVRARLQTNLLTELYRLPFAFFLGERSGRLHNLISQDATTAARILGMGLSEAILGILQLVFVLFVLVSRYGQIAWVALALIPLYLVFPLLSKGPMREISRQVLAATSETNTVAQESVQAVREIKVLGREEWAVDRLGRLLEVDILNRFRYSLLNSIFGLQYIIYFSVAGGVYWFGGLKVVEGTMTVGQLVALVALLGHLEGPVSRLTRLGSEYQRFLAVLERFDDILGPGAPQHEAGSLEVCPGGHRISFERVVFGYQDLDGPVLRGVSFVVEPGERVAIVGASGAGKSTIVSLLARLHDPQEGRILIDGQDIREYSIRSLRKEVGFVLQDVVLFAGTVRENIRIGHLEATDQEIEECARVAYADEFIRSLPEGYETEIGERGAKLSGGQRQRIGIARILLRNPGILVLDEAMSSLDSYSERWVRDSLESIMKGRTTFLIAHRPSAFVDADQILFLDEGKIIAGRHGELIEKAPGYRKLLDEVELI